MPVYKDKLKKDQSTAWYFKTSINGRSFLRRGFKSKKEAIQAEAIFISKNIDIKNKAKNLTYCELLNEYKNYLKNALKSTIYCSNVKKIDSFYKTLFPNISINRLLYKDVLKAREIIDKKQTSSVDKNRNIRFLIRFFHYVKIYHYIDFSEIEKMQPFRDDSIHRIKPKAKMVQFDEFKKIYAACNSDFYRLAFLTFYLFGLRLGELLGLTVEAFNFDDHIFEIFQEANFKTGSGGFIITTPKTNDSKRLYLMPETYEQIVIQHIKNYKLTSKDFIFFRARGKNIFRNEPRPEETFRRQANNYCRHIAPDFHFHMLRHSAVTYLHDKGVPLADISRFVGHGSINITEDVYLEKSQAKQKQIVSILEDTIKQLENSIKISIKK